MLLACDITWQNQSISLYNHYPLVTGTLQPTPGNIAKDTTLLRAEVAILYLFYTSLWLVKFSVLLFFRRLFGDRQQAPCLKAWWWLTTGFTVATWAACLGTIPYRGMLKPFPYILGK